jgi:rsbT co-antagonist protein RsbR
LSEKKENESLEVYVQRRVNTIGKAMWKVMDGDYDHIIPEETYSDEVKMEVESLAIGTNLMIEELKKMNEIAENELRKAEEYIAEKTKMIERQQETIQTLSTPVITIWDDVLTLPVIGIVDSRRTEEMMESLLNKVVATQSKCVIIDITGVDVVDTKTADHFLKMVKAVRLLGAECIITGISPDIAQTITNIGVDMSNIKTLRSLDQGLKEALNVLGIEFREKRK